MRLRSCECTCGYEKSILAAKIASVVGCYFDS